MKNRIFDSFTRAPKTTLETGADWGKPTIDAQLGIADGIVFRATFESGQPTRFTCRTEACYGWRNRLRALFGLGVPLVISFDHSDNMIGNFIVSEE